MDNKCAFCAQLVERFTRCNECGEAICADHRTLMPVGPRPSYAGTGLQTPTRYLCPDHVGLLMQAQAQPAETSMTVRWHYRPAAAVRQLRIISDRGKWAALHGVRVLLLLASSWPTQWA